MCGTIYSAVLYLSTFTFALMEDTGWYGIDYEYVEFCTCNFGFSYPIKFQFNTAAIIQVFDDSCTNVKFLFCKLRILPITHTK